MRIFSETLRESRNILIGVSVIAVSLILLVVAMYPGDEKALEILTTLENIGIYQIFIQATYGEGAEYRLFLAFEVFSYIFFIPIVMTVFLGSSVFAAEQDNNRLDILMSMPISRRRIFLEKWLSMLVISTIFVVIGFLASWIPSTIMNYKIPIDSLLLTWMLMLPLIVLTGTLASFFGIYYLDRFKARIYLFGLIALMFILVIISRTNDSLEFLSYFSIFQYYNGADILLKPNLSDIKLSDPLILLVLTLLLFILILWWVEGHDLIPHYDQEKPKKEGKVRGIPKMFFYVKYLRYRYPSLVEQITADRMIINLFLVFVVFIGLSGPLFYPGDAEWAITVKGLGSNILYDAMLQGRSVPPTLQGYMITQGYAALWLWFGIFIIVMGPRLVTRDNVNNTTDLLMANPVNPKRILLERILAFTLEMITLFVLIAFSSIIGQIYNNDVSGILYSTVSFGIAIVLYWAWALIGVLVATFLNNKPRLASSTFAGIYFVILVPYLFGGMSEVIKPLAQITPFYWHDAFAIFVEQSLTLETVGPTAIFLLTGFVAVLLSIYWNGKIDTVDTFEDKSLEARNILKTYVSKEI
ncbi:MAG: ABC transporter permease [Candidatus Thorarchaeota archaeon]